MAKAANTKRGKGFSLLGALIVWGLVLTVGVPVGWALLYRFVEAPGTLLMLERSMEGESISRTPKPLSDISPHLVRAVIAAEDSRFCTHNGFDVEAIQDAMEFNEAAEERGSKRRRGASTISQQTAKNLFLWADRSWVRKGLETYFTVIIENTWPKRRIVEAYLNAAEFGQGRFGAEAAAQGIFGKSAAKLTPREAATLAAILPSPNKWRADKPGPFVRRRAGVIQSRMQVVAGERLDGCVWGEKAPPPPPRERPAPAPKPDAPAAVPEPQAPPPAVSAPETNAAAPPPEAAPAPPPAVSPLPPEDPLPAPQP